MRGRPHLVLSYAQDDGLVSTRPKRLGIVVLVVVAAMAALVLTDDVLLVLTTGLILAIGAIGLNLVTGYAGQISLAHAFFLGVGAYTAAVLGDEGSFSVVGLGLPVWVWLPAAVVMAALVGALVGPIAGRLRGLYCGVVTLGLVFVGEYIFREARPITGGLGIGRTAAVPEIGGVSIADSGPLLGLFLTDRQRGYLLALLVLVIAAIVGRNIARSATGRAFAAIRDRDVAAAVIGVQVRRYKTLAFCLSAGYAGLAGALLYSLSGYVEPSSFGFLTSVKFVAIIFIGGLASISGSIMGALFVAALAPLTRLLAEILPLVGSGPGALIDAFELEAVCYGLAITAFLIFEPRGLFGIWIRIRGYFTSWPFSY